MATSSIGKLICLNEVNARAVLKELNSPPERLRRKAKDRDGSKKDEGEPKKMFTYNDIIDDIDKTNKPDRDIMECIYDMKHLGYQMQNDSCISRTVLKSVATKAYRAGKEEVSEDSGNMTTWYLRDADKNRVFIGDRVYVGDDKDTVYIVTGFFVDDYLDEPYFLFKINGSAKASETHSLESRSVMRRIFDDLSEDVGEEKAKNYFRMIHELNFEGKDDIDELYRD